MATFPQQDLSDYLAEVRRLVHDPNDVYWSQADKTANINKAIKMRDVHTGANRTIISLTLTAGTDTYTLSTLGNARVFDVVGINLIYGGQRIVLGQKSYTKLNTLERTFTTSRNRPGAWCKYNTTTVILGPIPSIAFVTEWDCCVTMADLSSGTDVDTLTGIFTVPVPYWAAYLCKQNSDEPERATWFCDEYYKHIATCQGARSGMMPNAYA